MVMGSRRLIKIFVIAIAAVPSLGAVLIAQDAESVLDGFSNAEKASIRSACQVAGYSGPASLYNCLRTKAGELRRSPGEPNLSVFSIEEQASIRSACQVAGY